MKDVFVSHPGLQHAHQLATALNEKDRLQAVWTGTPLVGPAEAPLFWLPKKSALKLKHVNIPPDLRRHPVIFQALLKGGSYLFGSTAYDDYAHRIFHLFDWWVSLHVKQLGPRVVVAFENSATQTFLAAKKIGAYCVLDAPSFHHKTSSDLITVKPSKFREEINRRKDREVELANMVITCSPLAAQSYLKNGVAKNKIRNVLLGATFPPLIGQWQPHAGPIRFIFAGALSQRKSIDIILSVFNRLATNGFDYRLSFVGGEAESGWVDQIRLTPNAVYHPSMPQSELYKQLSNSDCILLPSRFDSFGMVVAEAMACGTPAVVSTNTGAKAMIEQFPKSGWIVEADEGSLYECVKNRIKNRNELFSARIHAKAASNTFTWGAYRHRIAELSTEWVL